MKKIILSVIVLICVVGMAFAASCYKYHYVLSAHCRTCHQYQTLECDRDGDNAAIAFGKNNFYNHADDCTNKSNTCMSCSIVSREELDYVKCGK